MASAVTKKEDEEKTKIDTWNDKAYYQAEASIYTDAVMKLLFGMGFTSYNISQRLSDIEVLLRPLVRDDEEARDCFDCST